jgi:hypothetical protein
MVESIGSQDNEVIHPFSASPLAVTVSPTHRRTPASECPRRGARYLAGSTSHVDLQPSRCSQLWPSVLDDGLAL